jgi:hypothetical protein
MSNYKIGDKVKCKYKGPSEQVWETEGIIALIDYSNEYPYGVLTKDKIPISQSIEEMEDYYGRAIKMNLYNLYLNGTYIRGAYFLCEELRLIEREKPKQYGIVEFCRKNYK